MALSEFDRQLVKATRSGLPLVPRPYEAVAAMLGTSSERVREHLAALLAQGLVRHIGAEPNFGRLGCTTSAMTVWDVDDAQVDALGPRVGAVPGVSRCSRHPRRAPDWPYNLIAILHGRSREAIEQQRAAIRRLLGPACRADDVLYSSTTPKTAAVWQDED